ncbi:MAG: hypothetical protein KGZ25_05810 [Planctomycetes bacterium]|nr:hypothetical protein [Planctomycetota bacterium]
MVPVVGAVVFPMWQAILLIVLCFGSLIIALYCLFFMVPLKSFAKRINSLGGGMRGIRKHLEGINQEIDGRIEQMRDDFEERLRDQREEWDESLTLLSKTAKNAEAGLKKLDGTTQSLQAEIRESSSDARKVARNLDDLKKQLLELQNDFQVLEDELEGSVRQMVNDSFHRLESTILSALESVQDEMLRGSSHFRGTSMNSGKKHSHGSSGHYESKKGRKTKPEENKIISAEPLFGEDVEEESNEEEAEEPETQEAPAK